MIPHFDARCDDLHLDHVFSILAGFREGISPKVIGSVVNLQMLPGKVNKKKREACWITKDQLLSLYSRLTPEDRFAFLDEDGFSR